MEKVLLMPHCVFPTLDIVKTLDSYEKITGLPVDLLTSDSLDDEFRTKISSEEVLIYERVK